MKGPGGRGEVEVAVSGVVGKRLFSANDVLTLYFISLSLSLFCWCSGWNVFLEPKCVLTNENPFILQKWINLCRLLSNVPWIFCFLQELVMATFWLFHVILPHKNGSEWNGSHKCLKYFWKVNWDPLIFGEGFFVPLVGFCFWVGIPWGGEGGETDRIEIYFLYSFQRGMLICRSQWLVARVHILKLMGDDGLGFGFHQMG